MSFFKDYFYTWLVFFVFVYDKGAFTNYVYKRRGVGGQKKSTFCKLLYHRKCKRRGVGGQKKPNLVNVVCERPLMGNVFSLSLGSDKGAFTNYVYKICLFLTTYPPPFTFSMV